MDQIFIVLTFLFIFMVFGVLFGISYAVVHIPAVKRFIEWMDGERL